MNEEWRRIPGHPDYEVSNLGRVRSWKAVGRGGPPPRYLAGGTSRGYRHVLLRTDGVRTTGFIHRLVAVAFIGPRPPKAEVRHLDGRKTNNLLTNLAYGTHAQNGADLSRHGTHSRRLITHCPKGHPYDEANTYLRKRSSGGRACRACNRDWMRKHAGAAPVGMGGHQRSKTHCPHGHEYTPENTYITKRGGRMCRACRADQRKRWAEKRRTHATNSSIKLAP